MIKFFAWMLFVIGVCNLAVMGYFSITTAVIGHENPNESLFNIVGWEGIFAAMAWLISTALLFHLWWQFICPTSKQRDCCH